MKNEAVARTIGPRAKSPLWADWVATLFGIGRARPGPGSWASAITVAVWLLLATHLPVAVQPWVAAALALVAIAVGIPSATRVSDASGLSDPQFVVIDEVAGQLITLIGVPLTWKSMVMGFILFRAFDIVKPPPVRNLERLPGGLGIVLDDVAAGFYALIIMQVFLHFRILTR